MCVCVCVCASKIFGYWGGWVGGQAQVKRFPQIFSYKLTFFSYFEISVGRGKDQKIYLAHQGAIKFICHTRGGESDLLKNTFYSNRMV